MKTSMCFLFFAFTFFTYTQVLGQTWSNLGAMNTGFEFTSNGQPMEIVDQFIIPRADHIAWEAGVQVYHLEFITNNPFTIKKKYGSRKRYFTVSFFDKKDQLLHQYEWSLDRIETINNNQNPPRYFHSIRLRHLPMILFRQTERIDITQHDISFKHTLVVE